MSYNIYVAKVKNIRPAQNADRLNLCEVFGNTTVVDKSVNENDLYLYFPIDGQISEEFGLVNNLFRRKDENGNQCGGFIDPIKRNIRAIKLRGNRSDGLVLPLTALKTFGDISSLKEGDIVTVFNGHEIACKYIPKVNYERVYNEKTNRTRKKKVPIAPLFTEHADTEQLVYNLDAFKPNDEIEISLKMHGTSQRTGYLPVFKRYTRTLWDRITHKQGKPVYEYDYISGTRRTVLENFDSGFYGSNTFRQQHHDKFVGKLQKGETVYYEVVGFTDSGVPIMGNGKNEKLGKDFVKQYGKETVFSYGCGRQGLVYKEANYATGLNKEKVKTLQPVPQSDIYVYRMTMTNEDGFIVEYSPDFMRYRCEQMGIKCVPNFIHFILHDYDLEFEKRSPGEIIKEVAEHYYSGPDPIGKTHIREGVVVRIVNRPKFTAFKHKNYDFKVLSGIIVDEISNSTSEISEDILSEL